MKRRSFLASSLALPAFSLVGCGDSGSSGELPAGPGPGSGGNGQPGLEPVGFFEHGVASGDPLDDRVILWTRVTPAVPTETSVPVQVLVSRQPDLSQPQVFTATAEADSDFCVKVDERDLDFVLHLGDYLYEYEPGTYDDPAAVPNRVHEPANEILSLSDYRVRHGQYKRDPDLQAVHQQYPMICIWDDHEIANDACMDGAENHDPATEGDWETRKQAAIRAYFEWMPVRDFGADSQRLWRRFRYGDLIDLWMLDTRIEGRDAQASLPFGPERTDPDRKLISDAQMNWLTDGLTSSGSLWKMIGQQVMFGQLNLAELPQPELISEQLPYGTTQQGLKMDQWDGYTASRTRILDAIEQNNVENVVVFTGDIHTSWANEIYRNPASVVGELFAPEALAVEFVCPSVTSPGFPAGLAELAAVAVRTTNPHVKYAELQTRGFILMGVDRFGAQAEFHYVASIADETRKGELDTGKRKLVKVAAKQPGQRYRLITDNLTPSRPRTTQTSLLAPAATPEHQQELAAVMGAVHSLESVV
jgi:alkaline phosphatase D